MSASVGLLGALGRASGRTLQLPVSRSAGTLILWRARAPVGQVTGATRSEAGVGDRRGHLYRGTVGPADACSLQRRRGGRAWPARRPPLPPGPPGAAGAVMRGG